MQNSSAEVLQIPDEVMDSCVKMDNPEVVDASLEGQYVWAQGDVKTPGMLRDNGQNVALFQIHRAQEEKIVFSCDKGGSPALGLCSP